MATNNNLIDQHKRMAMGQDVSQNTKETFGIEQMSSHARSDQPLNHSAGMRKKTDPDHVRGAGTPVKTGKGSAQAAPDHGPAY